MHMRHAILARFVLLGLGLALGLTLGLGFPAAGQAQIDFGAGRILPLGQDSVCMTIADLNADGIVDLLVGEQSPAGLALYFGDGEGRFRFHERRKLNRQPTFLQVDDFDSDGLLDLACCREG